MVLSDVTYDFIHTDRVYINNYTLTLSSTQSLHFETTFVSATSIRQVELPVGLDIVHATKAHVRSPSCRCAQALSYSPSSSSSSTSSLSISLPLW